MTLTLTIPFRIIPKKRHYRRKMGGGFYLSKEFKDFEEACLTWLLQWGNQYIPGKVRVQVVYHFKNGRHIGDEDNLNATIGDLLQKGGFVQNDKLIHWAECQRVIDGTEGAEIEITKWEGA